MSYDTYQDIIMSPRPILGRKGMDLQHRAKQFAPFAALKGFEDCVRKEEIVYEPRRELAEDQKAELNFRMRMLHYGMCITVIYYVPSLAIRGKGVYETYTGMVKGWDKNCGLQMDTRIIASENLYDIRGDGFEVGDDKLVL